MRQEMLGHAEIAFVGDMMSKLEPAATAPGIDR
jgi:hypothetical protein